MTDHTIQPPVGLAVTRAELELIEEALRRYWALCKRADVSWQCDTLHKASDVSGVLLMVELAKAQP